MEQVHGGSVSVRGVLKALLSRRAADRMAKNKMEAKAQEAKGLNPDDLRPKEAKSVLILKTLPLFYTLRRGKAYRRAFLAKKLSKSQLSLTEEEEALPVPTAKEIVRMNRIHTEAMNKLA